MFAKSALAKGTAVQGDMLLIIAMILDGLEVSCDPPAIRQFIKPTRP